MYTYTFLEKPTTDQKVQILALYHAEKWWPENIANPNRIDMIIKGSHCILIVQSGEEVIGMGRALSDNTGDAYLHDITVKKQYRKKGIGNKIVKSLLQNLKRDGITWVGLIAENKSSAFYTKHNFSTMKNASPMFIEL